MHDALIKKTVTRNEARLGLPEIREILGLPADAEIKLEPVNDGKNFELVAKWTGGAPVAPAAAPGPDSRPREQRKKGTATPPAGDKTEAPKEQPQAEQGSTPASKPAPAGSTDGEDVP